MLNERPQVTTSHPVLPSAFIKWMQESLSGAQGVGNILRSLVQAQTSCFRPLKASPTLHETGRIALQPPASQLIGGNWLAEKALKGATILTSVRAMKMVAASRRHGSRPECCMSRRGRKGWKRGVCVCWRIPMVCHKGEWPRWHYSCHNFEKGSYRVLECQL